MEARVAGDSAAAARVAAGKATEKSVVRSGSGLSALEMAKKVTKGHVGSTGLALAGIATLLGVGISGRKTNNSRADRSAEMNARQRYNR